MKRILLIVLSIVVAFAAYAAVVRPSHADVVCSATPESSDGQMNLDVPTPSTDAEYAFWNSAPAPPSGLTSDSAGGIRLYGTLQRCAADNALPEWAQSVITWSIYVGVGLIVAQSMVAGCALPSIAGQPELSAACLAAIPGVSGGVAGAVSAYFAEGMKSGNWGWPAFKEALKSGLQSAGLSAAIGLAFAKVPTTVGELLKGLASKMSGIGWYLWMSAAEAFAFLAQYSGGIANAITEVEQGMGIIVA